MEIEVIAYTSLVTISLVVAAAVLSLLIRRRMYVKTMYGVPFYSGWALFLP
ncbi:hypothetical protein ACH0BF_07570 [Pseudobacillus sp. 179-B 2D1 NHS]|uniref:hypothetical protein n=1 Tax=Pseudobacillus sp. 179-B 2D1 NHS TaxID=3374292 RepID=UPI0038793E79